MATGDRVGGTTMKDSEAGGPRIAAIDIGSNAMRITIAKVRASGRPRQLDYYRAPVRLGEAAFLSGRLTDEKLERGAEAVREFRRRMDRLRVDRYRAVATSAVRDASNGPELVERARRESAIEIEVIDGTEEARLVWVAVRERLEVSGRWLLVDLGGGSLEVSVVGEEGLERSASYPLGTVRLLERLEAEASPEVATGPEGEPSSEGDGSEGDAVERALAELEGELTLPAGGRIEGLMATGGNIETLAELARAETNRKGASRLSLKALSRTMAKVEALSYERRMSKLGLRPDRADVIVPAGRIYRRVAELAGVGEIVVPNLGVADGILLELSSG